MYPVDETLLLILLTWLAIGATLCVIVIVRNIYDVKDAKKKEDFLKDREESRIKIKKTKS